MGVQLTPRVDPGLIVRLLRCRVTNTIRAGFVQIADFSEKLSFYVMGCVSFFKSSRADIKANAALFVGESYPVTLV